MVFGLERPRLSSRVAAAALTGLLAGVGLGILMADGRKAVLFAIPLLALSLWRVLVRLIDGPDRGRVGAIIGLAFALHLAVAVVLFSGSLATGNGGFIPGDDREYALLADHYVRYIRGDVQPPWVPES